MAPEKAPAFQFYPRDFLTDGRVAAMSLEERGAYITLLSLCWLEHVLPDDIGKLSRMVGVAPVVFRRLWPALEPCFTRTNAGLTQKRLESERQKQADRRTSLSERGSKGASKRWAS